MDVSENRGTPKSSILIGFSIIFHHPFWGTSIFGNTYMDLLKLLQEILEILREKLLLERSNGWFKPL